MAWQASRCQQAFSKPCLVNLISKDTHLVFSISVFRDLCCKLHKKGNHCFNYEGTVKSLILTTAGYFSLILNFAGDASEIRAFVAEVLKLATELNWLSDV